MRAIDYFDKSADLYPDRIAVLDGDCGYSYREARAFSERIARGMLASGVGLEERAAIYSHNHPSVLFCMLGILRAGAAWVPINFRNAADANVEFLNYSETTWLFYHSHFKEQVEDIRRRVPRLRHFVCIDAPVSDESSLPAFMERGSGGSTSDWADEYGNLDQMMGLVPTGGTTGPARGVRVTNLAWGTMTESAMRYWKSDVANPVCLCTAPLSHAAAPVSFSILAMGGTNIVLPGFDAGQVLWAIEHYRVTHMFLPPTAFYSMLAHPEVGKFDYSRHARVFAGRFAGVAGQVEKGSRGVWTLHVSVLRANGSADDSHIS